MRLSQLSLKNFRCYSEHTFSFDPELTLVVGPNGSGKTNILEAIYLLAAGRSWRTEASEEMILFGEEVAHASITHQVSSMMYASRKNDQFENSKYTELSVTLTRGAVQGQRVAKAKYKVDGVAKRKSDFVGRLKVVLFEPQSLMIVIGDPSHRRGFLDEALLQTDAEYRNDLHLYFRALRVRNRLLDAIRDGKANREQLEFWERAMVKHGEGIQKVRGGLVEWLNGQMAQLASKGDSLQGDSFFRILYEPSLMSEERLTFYREREIAAGFSLVGPQRDDLSIIASEKREASSVKGRPLAQYGSRGAQRMAVLRLKLAEAQWIEEKTGESPVLLLDDIYSELDDEHDRMIQELIGGRQTIITATESPSGYPASGSAIRL